MNNTYSDEDKTCMLQIAARSIKSGLETGNPLDVSEETFSENLQHKRATFVTLESGGLLRGCIGSLEAYRPLMQDIASNAFSAAFNDPRFNTLSESEYPLLDIHISILSPPEPMTFDSEESLLQQIQPGIDGLILSDMGRRSTFLPSVWEQLPEKQVFLSELKRKAGLPGDHWSNTIQFQRYSTFCFGDSMNVIRQSMNQAGEYTP